MRIALAVARFYGDLADMLVAGARRALVEAGIEDIDELEVPGAFELPMVAKLAAESGRYDGVVCLGAVIRGETTHYDYVCNEAARGIQQVQLDTGVPTGFGVLTVENYEQAVARAGDGKRDSGAHAAEAVIALLKVKTTVARS